MGLNYFFQLPTKLKASYTLSIFYITCCSFVLIKYNTKIKNVFKYFLLTVIARFNVRNESNKN